VSKSGTNTIDKAKKFGILKSVGHEVDSGTASKPFQQVS
jgi:hypothetical protein